MRLNRKFLIFCLALLIMLISCSKQTIKIKNSNVEQIGIETANIRTTNVDINEEVKEIIKEPQIDILSPKDGQLIKDGNIIVILNISNFKLVTPNKYPKKGQGHVQVWLNDMEFRDSSTVFIFENESNGTYTIKAELLLSNNTVLPYSKVVTVIVNNS